MFNEREMSKAIDWLFELFSPEDYEGYDEDEIGYAGGLCLPEVCTALRGAAQTVYQYSVTGGYEKCFDYRGMELLDQRACLIISDVEQAVLDEIKTTYETELWLMEDNPSKVDWNGKKGEPLPEEVKDRLRKEYQRAKKDYDAKLACTYYTSVQFRKDVTYAAVNVGARMGVRQALGFVFAEIWFAVKDELQKFDNQEADIKDYLEAIASGIEAGVSNVKKRYPEMCSRFLNGAAAGALSSLTTTLCNIFFTTAKSTVRIIRQSYASIVQAMEVLFINPDNYEFGDRMRAVVKVLSIGASVTVGVLVSDAVARTPLGVLGKTGEIVQSFCGAFVTGIMSCTLLMYLDRSKITNQLVQQLNNIHTLETELNYYRRQAAYFEQYAAQLMQIDLEQFEKETQAFKEIAAKLDGVLTAAELNSVLRQAFIARNLPLPWEGFENFDSFMHDNSAHLVFQ